MDTTDGTTNKEDLVYLREDAQDDENQDNATGEKSPYIEFGEKIFKLRDYTPIPLIILLFIFAKPTVATATFGLLIVMMGELLRIYAVGFIGSISRTRKNRTGGNLISSGPFGYVRNPLYVGNFFISVGLAIFAGNLFIILLTALLFGVQYFFIVKYEESLLNKTFGEEYREYCDKVPAWFPRRSVKLDELDWPDTLSPALRSEKKTLLAIAGVLVFLLLFS